MDEAVIIESSGNVFADAGLPDADLPLLKAQILGRILKAIEERGLTQTEAGGLMGVKQPVVAKLAAGKIRGFSLDKLIGFLTSLDMDVDIVVKPKPKSRRAARIKGRIAA